MKVADVGATQVFTHIDDETGVCTTYASELLAEYCFGHAKTYDGPTETSDDLKWEGVIVLRVPVEAHHAKYCIEKRGFEQHRFDRLFGSQAAESPILFIQTPDKSMLLADGTHRYVLHYALSRPTIAAYFVTWDVAKPFIVEDAQAVTEAALLQMRSGV